MRNGNRWDGRGRKGEEGGEGGKAGNEYDDAER